MNEVKQAQKKIELVEKMKKYVDDMNIIDIYNFRKDYPKEYSLLPHYFGSIDKAIEENNWTKIQKINTDKGYRLTLRNQLAYDMLVELRKNHTLEEIAQIYGVTKPLINQLFQALDINVKLANKNKQ